MAIVSSLESVTPCKNPSSGNYDVLILVLKYNDDAGSDPAVDSCTVGIEGNRSITPVATVTQAIVDTAVTAYEAHQPTGYASKTIDQIGADIISAQQAAGAPREPEIVRYEDLPVS